MPSLDGGVDRLAGEHVADGLLEARRDVGDRHRLPRPLARLDPARDGGLETGERVVEAVPLQVAPGGQPAREVDVDAVALAGDPVDVRAARERQPEQPRDLVEGLAGRVVDRRAHRVDPDGDVLDPQQAGVAAADQHRQARLGQRAVLELVDGDVGGEVVDAVDRLAQPDRERLGRGDADHQRAGQAGAAGHRDRVDVGEPDAGGLAGALDRRHHRLEVRPAGDLRHHAAEAGVLVDAAGDRVGEQRVPADDPDAGLVAGGLDPEDQRLGRSQDPLCRPAGGRALHTVGGPTYVEVVQTTARQESPCPSRDASSPAHSSPRPPWPSSPPAPRRPPRQTSAG